MAGAGQKRITKVRYVAVGYATILTLDQELGDLTTNPPAGTIVELKDDNNLHSWKVTMEGPAGSPYAVLRPSFHSPRYCYVRHADKHLYRAANSTSS